jgi:hypothetical protein
MTNAGTHLRQARTRHPGVKLLSRVRRTGTVWLARWVDPDTGRTKEVSLARLGLNSDEARVGWCKTKSRSIHQRRADLLSGVEPIQVTAIADTVNEFYTRRATLKTGPRWSVTATGPMAFSHGRVRLAWPRRRSSRQGICWTSARGGPCGRRWCRPAASAAANAKLRKSGAAR